MTLGVEAFLFDLTGIDHIDHIGDSDGGLSDVSGKDDAANTFERWLEDLLLLGDGDGRVERVDRVFG
jgi:hypothetical protein